VLNPPRLVVFVIPSDVSPSGRQAQAIKRKPWMPRLRYIHLDGYGPCYVLGTGFHPFSAVVIVVEADPCRLARSSSKHRRTRTELRLLTLAMVSYASRLTRLPPDVDGGGGWFLPGQPNASPGRVDEHSADQLAGATGYIPRAGDHKRRPQYPRPAT
jgi:hypothetical protein